MEKKLFKAGFFLIRGKILPLNDIKAFDLLFYYMQMKNLYFLLLIVPFVSKAQLTVEKIMQDPKWLGTSPSQITWSYDSKSINFKWNPDKATSDSFYTYQTASNKIVKPSYSEAKFSEDISKGIYNAAKTKIAFIHNNDVYYLTVATKNIIRITNTTEQKFNPSFLKNDNIVYQLQDDLYEWNSANGATTQLTHFENGNAPAKNADISLQQKWLNNEALQTSSVIKKRKDKADAAKKFLDSNKDEKALRTIYVNNKDVQNITVSSDGRFVTYRLYQKNDDAKETFVPSYVNAEGYTKEIPSRPKIGRPAGDYSFYVFDKLKDTVIEVSTDSIPYINYKPEYLKNYPDEINDSDATPKKVIVQNVLWNDDATACIVDIFSLDNKDRWIMQLDAETGKLTLINRQHDDAWIAGPGIAWLEPANIGWINANTIYFQSEVTGFSHLYTYNINTHQGNAITSGNYEIQKAVLNNNKKYFYIISNEEEPGKQNIYRINIDGSNKTKLTSLTGGYEMFLSPDEKYIAYRYSYQTKPWELYLQQLKANSQPQQITDKAMSDSFKSYQWRDTKIFIFKARDSADVYAHIYEPKPGTKNNAAVIFVHGAGYLQNI
ncbi:MAG TPA: DPP IV N-terminal domain-containing protein, partial [Parafilimonas sp.]